MPRWWRPSSAGLILNTEDIKKAETPDEDVQIQKGVKGCITIDWGAKGQSAVLGIQEISPEHFQIPFAELFEHPKDDDIYESVGRASKLLGTRIVRADSSHPFLNRNLKEDYHYDVEEIKFVSYKSEGVGVMRFWFEKERIIIPDPKTIQDDQRKRNFSNRSFEIYPFII